MRVSCPKQSGRGSALLPQHELAHQIHRTFEPKSGHGQEPEAETIAQLVAATLARLYGRPADGFSWSNISSYAQKRLELS